MRMSQHRKRLAKYRRVVSCEYRAGYATTSRGFLATVYDERHIPRYARVLDPRRFFFLMLRVHRGLRWHRRTSNFPHHAEFNSAR